MAGISARPRGGYPLNKSTVVFILCLNRHSFGVCAAREENMYN